MKQISAHTSYLGTYISRIRSMNSISRIKSRKIQIRRSRKAAEGATEEATERAAEEATEEEATKRETKEEDKEAGK